VAYQVTGVGLHGGKLFLQFSALPVIIGVEEGNIVKPGMLYTKVPRCGRAQICLLQVPDTLWISASNAIDYGIGAIIRPIINNEYFTTPNGLPEN
jgi:hypothetical protein